MRPLKTIIPALLCLLLLVGTAGARDTVLPDKIFYDLLRLLQKEAAYFEGRQGFIQVVASKYNVFVLEKLSVTDSQIVNAYRMRDRFGNDETERYVEETVLLEPGLPIARAEIYYDYNFYFRNFPEAQFLLIEFKHYYPLANHIVSIYKDLKTGKESKSELHDTTYQIVLPIRLKSRKKIFKMIDAYQRLTLKEELILNGEL